jgi:hypothetical protein
MDRYINLRGQLFKLTEFQFKQIEEILHQGNRKLSSIPVGETFRIYNYEFIVLEQGTELATVIRKDVVGVHPFSFTSNNYKDSNADDICSSFAEELSALIGDDNVLLHCVDLTSSDGLIDYGTINRKASLLTADQYRKYVYILDKFKPKGQWFLATAYSTPKHGYTHTVMCVTGVGSVRDEDIEGFSGIRPYCVLKSDIFVSV